VISIIGRTMVLAFDPIVNKNTIRHISEVLARLDARDTILHAHADHCFFKAVQPSNSISVNPTALLSLVALFLSIL
jgi:hypothetical protein